MEREGTGSADEPATSDDEPATSDDEPADTGEGIVPDDQGEPG
jgi:hypothetical protein